VNVAILIIEMAELSGAGGAERFNADLFDAYNKQTHPKRKLFFISDNLSPLHKIGRLNSFPQNQLIFKSYRCSFFYQFTRNRPRIDKYFNYLRTYLTSRSLVQQLKKHKIGAIQMPVYDDKDFDVVKSIDKMPDAMRPKIILNLTNAVVQNHYFDENPRYAYHSKLNYGRLFEQINVDGVYTWYEASKKFIDNEKVIKSNPLVHNVCSRFTSTAFYEDTTNRENKIIFSGRLSEYKDPMLFVKAAEILNAQLPDTDWKFEMYGTGPLENEVRNYISDFSLSKILSLSHSADMPSILKKSKIYVSTQNVENFPSLAMAEAMACCNLIIARNVGQTDLYVKDGINGYLLKSGEPEELADILIKLINHPQDIDTIAKKSIKLLKEVHNEKNFITEIDEFWDKLNV